MISVPDKSADDEHSDEHTVRAKIHVEFEDQAHPNGSSFGKLHSRIMADEVHASGLNRFVRPEYARNDRQDAHPQSLAFAEVVRGPQVSHRGADHPVVIQPAINVVQVPSVERIEPLKMLERFLRLIDALFHSTTSPDDGAYVIAIPHIRDKERKCQITHWNHEKCHGPARTVDCDEEADHNDGVTHPEPQKPL